MVHALIYLLVAVSALPVRVRERVGGVRASAQFEREQQQQQLKEKERNSDPARAPPPAPTSAREKPSGEWLIGNAKIGRGFESKISFSVSLHVSLWLSENAIWMLDLSILLPGKYPSLYIGD